MADVTLRGLSWGHRRAMAPLTAAAALIVEESPGLRVTWDNRPLSAFVSENLADVVESYDLVSFDHPFAGTVCSQSLFVPLDQHLPHLLGEQCTHRYVGPSLASYRYHGTVIGAPIDAAVQHAIYRADLLDRLGETVPSNWTDALALGRRIATRSKFIGVALTSPHSFLTFASLCANMGHPFPDDPRQAPVLDRNIAHHALLALSELAALAPPAAIGWDSIALHDAMSHSDDIVYCPCEFGYATYGESDVPHRLSFSDFAGLEAPFFRGAILGGVGLGIPVSSPYVKEAIRFVEFASRLETQRDVFATHHGQPAFASIWQDESTDRRFNGYFSSVGKTMANAVTRPRFPGFIHTQFKAGLLVENCVRGESSFGSTVDGLCRLFEADAQRLQAISP